MRALHVYDAVRRPIGNSVCETSLRVGYLYELTGLPEGVDEARVHAGDQEELAKVSRELTKIWSFHTSRMPEDDWLLAEEMLSNLTGNS